MGFFFFFQAEDGIRDADVTGVQTCALPISSGWSIEGEVKVEENLGAEVLVFFPVDAAPVETDEIVSIREGEEEEGLLAQDARAIFTARLPSGTRQLIGKKIRLALDPERCYFFDPDTGESLLARKAADEPI